MKIIGLLNWYEEAPGMLAECVASLKGLCDHIIAVDGAYAEFPGALNMPASGADQAEIIMRVAAGAGMGCTIHSTREPWWGNEIEKRSKMFELGRTVAGPADWFLRIDADEMLTRVSADARDVLDKTPLNVAEAMLWDRTHGGSTTLRCLFRNLPGLRVEQAHYIVTANVGGERRFLRGPDGREQEPAEQLLDLRIEHRSEQRSELRKRRKADYYSRIPDFEHIEEMEK